jgi:hypothetical protein
LGKLRRAWIMAVVASVLFIANACAFRTPNLVQAEDNPPACSKVALLVGINTRANGPSAS